MAPDAGQQGAGRDWAVIGMSLAGILVATALLQSSAWFATRAALEFVQPAAASPTAVAPEDEAAKRLRRKMDQQMRVGVDSPQEDARRARLLKRARKLMARQAYPRAVEPLERILEMSPRDHVTLELLGRCLLGSSKLARARLICDRAIAANPLYLPSRRTRVKILLRLGEREQALDDLSLVLRHRPDDTQSRALRARLYERRGELHRALADWHAALASSPARKQRHACRSEIDRLVGLIINQKKDKGDERIR